jgi:ABC-type Fe3+ transport system substrate-binding protein
MDANLPLKRRLFMIGGASASLAATLGPAHAAADPALVAAAKKEGTVTWYSTLIVNQVVRPLATAFEALYPGISVQYSRSPAGEIALKVNNEARAGRLQADLFDGSAGIYNGIGDNLLEPYVPPAAADYTPDLKDPNGLWNVMNQFIYTTGVNTDIVPAAQIPKTFEDLLDPRWKGGKIAITTDPTVNGPPGFVGNILLSMGQDKGMAYLHKLAAQGVVNVPAAQRVVLDQVINGQYPVALMIINYHAVLSGKEGAPCAWLKMEPVVQTLNYVSLLKNAQHPNAAKLLIDFLLSEAGQTVIQKSGYIPGSPKVPAADPTLKPDGGHFKSTLFTIDLVKKNLPEWTKIANDIFK